MAVDLVELSISIFMFFHHIVCGTIRVFIPAFLKKHDITGKLILITGGGSGIGRLMCKFLAEEGAKIVTVDIDEQGLDGTVKYVKKSLPNAVIETYKCDVSNRNAVFDLANKIREKLGPVQILINNAGVVSGKPFLELTEQEIHRTINVNAISHCWTCQAFLPDMLALKDGHIVTIASVAGLNGCPRLVDYCMSKYASVGFEESLKYELNSEGHDYITSTCVNPFFIDTGMFEGASTSIVSFLKAEYVAKEIVSAILCRKRIVLIPKLMYFLYFLKSFIPADANYAILRILNGHVSMKSFRGRKSKSS